HLSVELPFSERAAAMLARVVDREERAPHIEERDLPTIHFDDLPLTRGEVLRLGDLHEVSHSRTTTRKDRWSQVLVQGETPARSVLRPFEDFCVAPTLLRLRARRPPWEYQDGDGCRGGIDEEESIRLHAGRAADRGCDHRHTRDAGGLQFRFVQEQCVE